MAKDRSKRSVDWECDCEGKGWDVYNEGDEFLLGEIQRCDTCKVFATDFDAACAAEKAGYKLEIQEWGAIAVIRRPDPRSSRKRAKS